MYTPRGSRLYGIFLLLFFFVSTPKVEDVFSNLQPVRDYIFLKSNHARIFKDGITSFTQRQTVAVKKMKPDFFWTVGRSCRDDDSCCGLNDNGSDNKLY